MRRIIGVLGIVLGLLLTTPGVAVANTNCYLNPNAGCVKNISSTYSLRVGRDWCGTAADPGLCNGSPTTYIARGTWSPYYDTDALYVPAGYTAVHCSSVTCTYWRETGWHKISNAVNWHVALARD